MVLETSQEFDYINSVNEILKNSIIKDFNHFVQIKSILTENSKEVSLINNTIIIKPIDKCITIRGINQSVNHPSLCEVNFLYENFREFIKNDKDKEGLNYEEFIQKRLNISSDYHPHLMCLYLEDYKGELSNYSKIHLSLDKHYVKKSRKTQLLLGCDEFMTVQRDFYKAYSTPFFFDVSLMIINKSLVITPFRNEGKGLKIKKFKLYLECDRWYKKE